MVRQLSAIAVRRQLTMTDGESDEPPTFARIGAERWTSMNAETNGTGRWDALVK